MQEGQLPPSEQLQKNVAELARSNGVHAQTAEVLKELVNYQAWGLRDVRKDLVLQTLTIVQFALVVMDTILFTVLTVGSGVKVYYPFFIVYPLLLLLLCLWLAELFIGPCWRFGLCCCCERTDRKSLYITELVVLLIFLASLFFLSLLNLGWTISYFYEDEVALDDRQLLWIDTALTSASLAVSLAALTRYFRLLGPFCCAAHYQPVDQEGEHSAYLRDQSGHQLVVAPSPGDEELHIN
jgi:hypothetical protein